MPTADELKLLITGDDADYRAALKDAEDATDKATRGMAGTFGAVGKAAAVAGAATVALGGLAVKAASDFETSFVGVLQNVAGTADELNALKADIRELGATGPTAAGDLNAVASVLGEIGGVAATQMAPAVEAVDKFHLATGAALDTATDGFARFLKASGEAPERLDRIANAAIATAAAVHADELAVVDFTTALSPTTRALGIATEATLGLAGAFVGAGVDSGRGATAIKATLADINAAVTEGGDSLLGFAQVAGMSVDEFSQLFQRDAAGALAAFLQGLQRANAEGVPVLSTLQFLGIEAGPAADALLRVAQSGVSVADAMAAAQAGIADTAALEANAAAATDTFAARLQTMKNQLTDVGITVGNAILPALTDVVAQLGPVLQTLAPAVQGLAGVIAEALGGLLPALQPIFQAIVDLVAALQPALQALVPALVEVANALAAGLAEVMPALLPIIKTLATLLAGALGAALGVVAQLLRTVAPILANVLVALQPLIDAAAEFAGTVLPPLLDILVALMPVFEALEPLLLVVANILVAVLVPAFEILGPVLGFVAQVLATVVGWVAKAIEALIQISPLVLLFADGGERVKDAWGDVLDFFANLWDGITKIWSAAGDWFKDIGKAIMDGLTEGLKSAVSAPVDAVKDGANKIVGGVKDLFGIRSPSKLFAGFGENIVEGFAIGLQGLRDVAGDMATLMQPGLDATVTTVNAATATAADPTTAQAVNSALQPPGAPSGAAGGGPVTVTLVFQEGAIQMPVQLAPVDFDPQRAVQQVRGAVADILRGVWPA